MKIMPQELKQERAKRHPNSAPKGTYTLPKPRNVTNTR